MVKVSKLRSMHAAVRRALLAAGSPNPCDDARVREAKAGFRRADIECRLSPEPVRVPIRDRVARALARRALVATSERRRRRTALVGRFWWLRRGSGVEPLRVGEVKAQADGSTHYAVPPHETEG